MRTYSNEKKSKCQKNLFLFVIVCKSDKTSETQQATQNLLENFLNGLYCTCFKTSVKCKYF